MPQRPADGVSDTRNWRSTPTCTPQRIEKDKPHEAIQMTATAHQNPTPTTGKGVAPSKPKTAAVVPVKAPKGIPDIAFPGGTVSPVCDGRVKITIDPGSGGRILGGS